MRKCAVICKGINKFLLE